MMVLYTRYILAQAANLFQALGLSHVELNFSLNSWSESWRSCPAVQRRVWFQFFPLHKFSLRFLSAPFALHHHRPQRRLWRAKRIAQRIGRRHAFHLEQDLADDYSDPVIGPPLPFPAGFSGFFVTGLSGTGGSDLPRASRSGSSPRASFDFAGGVQPGSSTSARSPRKPTGCRARPFARHAAALLLRYFTSVASTLKSAFSLHRSP